MKKYLSGAAMALTVLAGFAMAAPAFADTPATTNNGKPPMWAQGGPNSGRGGMRRPSMPMQPLVIGTVSSVNGTSLIVSGRQGFGTSTPATTYTVDASAAVVKKNNATSTLSSVVAGDTVVVQGTITGTSVKATMIRDGQLMMRPNGGKGPGGIPSALQGNGEPVVAGNVTAINGSTLTLVNKSNVSYTVDASQAKILEGNAAGTLANITIGTSVIVQGTVNGNSVTATTIIHGGQPNANGAENGNPGAPKARPGVFGQIGQFFMHLFGF